MASGITVNIKLERFYQEFLVNYFKTEERSTAANFVFPKEHNLSIKLNLLLSKPPEELKLLNYGNENFVIELPYCKLKDPRVYNYISANNQAILTHQIMLFFRTIFREEMNRMRSLGFQKKECVDVFISYHELDPIYYDRLIKDYHRYVNRICKIRSTKKRQKNLST